MLSWNPQIVQFGDLVVDQRHQWGNDNGHTTEKSRQCLSELHLSTYIHQPLNKTFFREKNDERLRLKVKMTLNSTKERASHGHGQG